MSSCLRLAPIIAAALLFLPAEGHAATSCARTGAKTLAANGQAVVYTRTGGSRLYGCLRRTGRAKLLVGPGDGYVTFNSFSHVTLAGHVVGYAETLTDVSCKGDCPPGYEPTRDYVVADDLQKHQTRTVTASATTVAVNARGWLAWLQAAGGQSELHLSKAPGADTVLDTGALDRVSFCGGQVLWRNGGQGRWVDG